MKYIEVALNLPLKMSFRYRVPTELAARVKIGSRVLVPFRNKNLKGFVTREREKGERKLKDVIKLVDDFPAISRPLLRLGEWVSQYYHCSLGQSLHSMLPIQRSLKDKEKKVEGKKISCPLPRPEVSCSGNLAQTSGGSVSLLMAEEPKEKISIFLSLAKDVLARGRQVVLVVPEVSYISSWNKLIQSEYGNCVAILHSRLKDRERYVSWMRMRREEAYFAIGTRCLLFAPFPDLGLMVIEEEENTSYKQREVPRYHAREVAARRGKIEGFPVVLMSQSPSLESWSRAHKKEYLPISTRATRKAHPEVEIIDLRQEEDKVLSRSLEEAVKEALERNELAILFLDRRGFSRYLLCQDCGEVLRCPNCNIGLTFHLKGALSCHYCGYEERSPLVCPYCTGNRLRGKGVGTQQVEKEAKIRFPGALIRRADLDIGPSLTGSALKDEVIKGKIDILIGTKLIIREEILKEARVVGIILADSLLNLPDFRAGERLFQLLVKIKRSIKKEGKMLIQTYNPTHYSLRCVRDREEDFYPQEMRAREELHYPPHFHWARVLLEGKTEARVTEASQKISQKLGEKGVEFLGPSPCPFAKIKGRYRYQLIVRDENPSRITACLKGEVGYSSSSTNAVKVSVDVDPQELM